MNSLVCRARTPVPTTARFATTHGCRLTAAADGLSRNKAPSATLSDSLTAVDPGILREGFPGAVDTDRTASCTHQSPDLESWPSQRP